MSHRRSKAVLRRLVNWCWKDESLRLVDGSWPHLHQRDEFRLVSVWSQFNGWGDYSIDIWFCFVRPLLPELEYKAGFILDHGIYWLLSENDLPISSETMRRIADDPSIKEDVRQALAEFRDRHLRPALENWTTPPAALRHIANHPHLPGDIGYDWLEKKFGPMAERWTLADAETQPDPNEWVGMFLTRDWDEDDDD